MQNVCAIVLCAGDGKRMRSARPKVLCEVLFQPMVNWITDTLAACGVTDVCLVCSDKGDDVQRAVPGAEYAIQYERRGTGHAVMQAYGFLEKHRGKQCIVLNGDAPFIPSDVIVDSHRYHTEGGYAVTVVTAELENPYGYGRILRDHRSGGVTAIVEQADADTATAAVREVNSGAYWFDANFLLSAGEGFTTSNKQNEYYITDAIPYALRLGKRVGGFKAENADVILGANDRAALMRLNEIARMRNIEAHLEAGVEILCADGVIIGNDVQIGTDTRILPGTILRGRVTVGSGCTIGPNTMLENCTVGNNTVINASQVFESSIGSGVRLGPYSYVRPGCRVLDNAKVGDFVELKNSVIGEKTSIAHLSYIGDTDLGANINVGGGVIVCNYDGKRKYRTTVKEGAFIGCNTNLIAPVTVEENAYVAAGSTITDTVPPRALSIARARQVNKENWKDKREL